MNQVKVEADASISKIREILSREESKNIVIGLNDKESFPEHLPEFDEVYLYSEKSIDIALSKIKWMPEYMKEDAKQYALLEVYGAWQKISSEVTTWKSYINQRAKGAIKDFIKLGKGDQAHKWMRSGNKRCDKCRDLDEESSKKCECKIARSSYLKSRVSVRNDKGEYLDVDEIAGRGGFYHEQPLDDEPKIKWDLLSRMASKDDVTLLVAKYLSGTEIQEMSDMSKVSRERFSQVINQFFRDVESKALENSSWNIQLMYALGLSSRLGLEDRDNGEGWDCEPADIFSDDIIFDGRRYSPQVNMFGDDSRVYNSSFKKDITHTDSDDRDNDYSQDYAEEYALAHEQIGFEL